MCPMPIPKKHHRPKLARFLLNVFASELVSTRRGYTPIQDTINAFRKVVTDWYP